MTTSLKSKEIQALRAQLIARNDDLRDEIKAVLTRSDNETYSALAEQVHDIGDESLADLLSDVNLATIDRHVSEAREIETALMRIAEGNYGRCIECGDDIGYQRLQAFATAKRCIRCQTAHEKRYGEQHATL